MKINKNKQYCCRKLQYVVPGIWYLVYISRLKCAFFLERNQLFSNIGVGSWCTGRQIASVYACQRAKAVEVFCVNPVQGLHIKQYGAQEFMSNVPGRIANSSDLFVGHSTQLQKTQCCRATFLLFFPVKNGPIGGSQLGLSSYEVKQLRKPQPVHGLHQELSTRLVTRAF